MDIISLLLMSLLPLIVNLFICDNRKDVFLFGFNFFKYLYYINLVLIVIDISITLILLNLNLFISIIIPIILSILAFIDIKKRLNGKR